MRRNIKRATRLLLAVWMGLLLCGCWSLKELRDIPIVVGIGIDDSADDPQNVFVTVQIVKPSALKIAGQSSGGSSTAKDSQNSQERDVRAFWNVGNSQSSVFKAFRELTHVVDNKLYLSHNQVIIFGQDRAKRGIQPCLDFLIREPETRPVMDVFVCATTGAEALDIIPQIGAIPAINLMKLAKAQRYTSHSANINLHELVNMLLSKPTAAVVPMIRVVEKNGQKAIDLDGTAVFEADKMVGELNDEETRGLFWVKGRVTGGIVEVRYQNEIVNLELLSARTKLTPKIEEGKIVMSVRVSVENILSEQLSKENLAAEAVLNKLAELECEEIKKEIYASFEKAKLFNADIFGFGELLHKRYPHEWGKIKRDWAAVFKTVELNISVDSVIRDTGLIGKPILPESN